MSLLCCVWLGVEVTWKLSDLFINFLSSLVQVTFFVAEITPHFKTKTTTNSVDFSRSLVMLSNVGHFVSKVYRSLSQWIINPLLVTMMPYDLCCLPLRLGNWVCCGLVGFSLNSEPTSHIKYSLLIVYSILYSWHPDIFFLSIRRRCDPSDVMWWCD